MRDDKRWKMNVVMSSAYAVTESMFQVLIKAGIVFLIQEGNF